MKRLTILAATVAFSTAVMACGGDSSPPGYTEHDYGVDVPSTHLASAAASCGLEDGIRDEGYTVTIDTEGEEEFSGDSYADVVCMVDRTDVPDRVIARIETTRALDGTQDAEWSGTYGAKKKPVRYAAFWNYHPDTGMNLTISADYEVSS